jgi:hypothetical protein
VKSKFLFLVIAVSIFLGIFLGVLLQRNFPVKRISPKVGVPIHQNEKVEKKTIQPPNTGIPEQAIGALSLFILAGQSNMSGYGEIDPKEVGIDPRVFVFGNDYRWKLAREPIDDPTGQVDPVSIDMGAGFSCGTTFAKTLLRNQPNWFIGLIPCAKHGSSIEEWQRNLSENSLYGSFLKRSLAASPMGRIKGLLFFQGETDALDPDLEPQKIKSPFQWEEKFQKFVKDIRQNLNIHDLPIVFAQIGVNQNSKEFKNWKIVQEQQSRVRLPNCKMIKTDDLSLRDGVHFDNKSYRMIGERFGQAMAEIISKRSSKHFR